MENVLWGAVDGEGTPVFVLGRDGDHDMYVMSHDLELFTAPVDELTLTGRKYQITELP